MKGHYQICHLESAGCSGCFEENPVGAEGERGDRGTSQEVLC